MKKKYIIDTEIQQRLIYRAVEIGNKINEMVHNGYYESVRHLHSKLNKMIYELAEKRGVSIWDICLNFMPEIEYKQEVMEGNRVEIRAEATIVPMPFNYNKYDGTDEKMP